MVLASRGNALSSPPAFQHDPCPLHTGPGLVLDAVHSEQFAYIQPYRSVHIATLSSVQQQQQLRSPRCARYQVRLSLPVRHSRSRSSAMTCGALLTEWACLTPTPQALFRESVKTTLSSATPHKRPTRHTPAIAAGPDPGQPRGRRPEGLLRSLNNRNEVFGLEASTHRVGHLFVCYGLFVTHYMGPEGPWQRRRGLNNLLLPRASS